MNEKYKTVIILLLSTALFACAATPGVMSLANMQLARNDAQQNFYSAEDFRLQFEYEKAFQHYRYSAFGGNQEAAVWLAKFYYDGIGTDTNYYRARRLFEMLAWQDKNDERSEPYLYLADIDFYGQGKPRTIVQGYKWMLIGTRNDPLQRAQLAAQMEPEMTEHQIIKAKRMAKKWLQWRNRDVSGI